MKSLLSFVSFEAIPTPIFNYKPWARTDYEHIDPLSTLNDDGKKVL